MRYEFDEPWQFHPDGDLPINENLPDDGIEEPKTF